MVPADSDRISRVPPYSGGALLAALLPVRGFHPLQRSFPTASRSRAAHQRALLQPRHCRNNTGLGSFPFDRHYSGNRYFFLFLRVLRCFSSPGSPQSILVHGLQPCGFSHSDIRGSQSVCNYPRLFAAYHVLHRLRKPRHPPFALVTFSSNELLQVHQLYCYTFLHFSRLPLKLQSLIYEKNSRSLSSFQPLPLLDSAAPITD